MSLVAQAREWAKSPADWRPARLKNAAHLQYGDALSAEQREKGNAIVYGSNGPVGTHAISNMLAPAIVVGRKGSFGKVTYAADGGFAIDTTYFIDRRSCSQNLRWLYYALSTLGLGETSQDTGVPGLSREKAYESRLRLPPIRAQGAIAHFLDRKTAAIDALIEKKQKLLELLAEKRAALINQAVTKGLDPNVPMKDSGNPWIGEVPTHWHLKRLKFLVREAVAGPYGASLTKAMYSTSGYRVYGQQQVIPDDFSVGDYYISADKFAEMQRYLVHPGDVLVSVMGTIGRVAVVPDGAEPGIINPRLVRYRPDTLLIAPRFMQAAILADCSQAYLRLMAQGATMDGLNMGSLAELTLPVPPAREQKAILADLGSKTLGVDRAEAAVRRQLDRLQEYRQALITAAVTGQLDISTEAA